MKTTSVAHSSQSSARRSIELSHATIKERENHRHTTVANEDDLPSAIGDVGEEWGAQYKRLVEYKTKYNDCNGPYRYATDLQLASWVQNQRYQYNLKMRNLSSRILEKCT
jgi:hypothetical protein